MPQSFFSVIVPTRNRPGDLSETFRTLLAQTRPAQEIVIVDQSETDESRTSVQRIFSESAARVRGGTKLTYLSNCRLTGLTAARNAGIAAAEGEIILFLDDDVLLEPDFVAELLKGYDEHPEAAGISGVITNYTRPGVAYRIWCSVFVQGVFQDDRQPVYWAAAVLHTRKSVRVTRLGGGLMSFRTNAIRGVEFDENLRGVADGEDVDFCIRLGPDAPLFMAPAARLVHNHSPHGREQGHWLRRHVRANVYLYRRNWRRGCWNRACMAWLNTGYVLVAIGASLRRLSVGPCRALLAGWREGVAAAGGQRALAVRPISLTPMNQR